MCDVSEKTLSEPIDPYGGDPRTPAEKIDEIELQMAVMLEALPPLWGRGTRALAANAYHMCIFRRLAAELRMYRAELRGDRYGQVRALGDAVRETHVAIEFSLNSADGCYARP